jgi:hypothetical protein
MSDTFSQPMINSVTGECHYVQMKPRRGLTVAEAEAFLAERKEAGKLINPENCDVIKDCTQVLDVYGIFEVPEEWWCVGNELFVRNLPTATGFGAATCRKMSTRRS